MYYKITAAIRRFFYAKKVLFICYNCLIKLEVKYMKLSASLIVVSDIKMSREFYEKVLG